jgi:PAS domain S-box-containing protein
MNPAPRPSDPVVSSSARAPVTGPAATGSATGHEGPRGGTGSGGGETPLGVTDVPTPPLIDLTALDLGGDVVFITDRDGTIVAVNDAFVRVTGFSRHEAIGATPRLLSSGLQDEDFYRDLWDTLLRGRVWEGQLVDRRRDGELRTHHATITPVHDGAGRITHFVAVERDLSGELSRHAGVGSTGLVHLDAGGRCVFADPRAGSLLDCQPEELLGRGLLDRLEPDDAHGLREVVERAMDTARTHRLDVRIANGAGWLGLEVQALSLSSGAVVGAAVGMEDVSERMAVHAELDRRDALTTSVLDSFDDPILVVSGDGTVLSLNAAWRAGARDSSPPVLPVGLGDDLFAVARARGDTDGPTGALVRELHRHARGLDEPGSSTRPTGGYRVTPLAWDDGGAVVRWHRANADDQG